MLILVLMLLIVGGLIFYIVVRLFIKDVQAHKQYEAYSDYVMAYGSEEETVSLMLDELEDLMIGMGGLVLLDMVDGELIGGNEFR